MNKRTSTSFKMENNHKSGDLCFCCHLFSIERFILRGRGWKEIFRGLLVLFRRVCMNVSSLKFYDFVLEILIRSFSMLLLVLLLAVVNILIHDWHFFPFCCYKCDTSFAMHYWWFPGLFLFVCFFFVSTSIFQKRRFMSTWSNCCLMAKVICIIVEFSCCVWNLFNS